MRLLALVMLLLSFPALGAYRLYQLRVTHYDEHGNPKKKETITSTLDPYQYEHYHSGYKWMKVDYVDSWYCPGDTGSRKACEKPREPSRLPASMEREKRLPINRQPVIP